MEIALKILLRTADELRIRRALQRAAPYKEKTGMKPIHTPITALALACTLASGSVLAASWTDRINIGGFASSVYNKTDSDVPFNGGINEGHDDQGSWAGTHRQRQGQQTPAFCQPDVCLQKRRV